MTTQLKSKLNSAVCITVVAAAFFISNSSQAAVSKRANRDAPAMTQTKDALQLPLLERLATLHDQGAVGYHNLQHLMFDRQAAMEDRWRATTALARLGGEKSRADLERALKQPEWYMRNAALIAVKALDRTTALQWSRRLLDDKALVVRAAAVDTIAEFKDISSSSLLWQKLYAPENFKSGQSLFIRRRIVETLSEMENTGREGKFIALLADRDDSLHAPAVQALERLTHQRLGEAKEPLKVKKAHWEQWWKEQKASL